jgi:hypothetical protein
MRPDAPFAPPKLNYEQFVKIFHLHVDHYSTQLCKVFDSDNSGKIGFRECAAPSALPQC